MFNLRRHKLQYLTIRYTWYKFSEKLKLSFVFWTMRSRHYFLMLLILFILVLLLAYLWLLWFPIDIPSNDSDKENGCLVWKALTGIFAPILICHLLYVHGERLLTAGRGLFGHQDERHTTADASYKNCGDDETTPLGTMESCSIPQTFREQPDFL